jgi:UDP-N-acetylmuramoyl-tripeptide--D-alanyl-D-alanine ligase
MRMQEKKWNKREIILDCYNANPLSMKAGADAFYNMKAEKKYFLYGEMRELGFNSKELHEDCAKYISSKNFDGVFLFGKYAKDLIEFFPKGMVKGISENSHEEMADILIKNTRNGDKIYIKGSRGIRLEYIFEEN